MMEKAFKEIMTKRQIINIFLLLGIFVALFALFRPSIWQERIETYLNNQLVKKGWSINISELSGHLFFNLYSDNVDLIHENGTSILFPKVSAHIELIPLIAGKIVLDKLLVPETEIRLLIGDDNNDSLIDNIKFKPEKIPININQIFLDGNIYTSYSDSIPDVQFLIDGKVNSSLEEMNISLTEIEISSSIPGLNFSGEGIDGVLSSKKIDLNIDKGNINDFEISGEFNYDLENDKFLMAELDLLEYEIPKKIFSQLPLQPELSKISAKLKIESDMNYYRGDLLIKNDLGLDMTGKFNLKRLDNLFQLDSLILTDDETSLIIIGVYEKAGRFNGIINLDNLDISDWISKSKETDLSGYLLINGEMPDNEISILDINAEISESILFEREPSSISGGISYQNNNLFITNPITLTIGPSIVSIKGEADFDNRSMNLDLSLTEASTFLINNFWSDSLNSGNATGSMKMFGSFNEIGINTELIINDFKYNDIMLDIFELSSEIGNLNNLNDGYVNLKFGNGFWKEYGFESGTGSFLINNNFIEISSFELKNKDDFFQFNGSIESDSVFTLDRLQFAYRNHYLINLKPVKILFQDDFISTLPFEIHVDDGVVEGFFKTNPIMGNLKFSNVTTDLLSLFPSGYSENLKGNIFGDLTIGENLNPKAFDLNVNLKNGEIANQPFDDLEILTHYNDGVLDLEVLKLTYGKDSNFNIKGILPVNYDSSRSAKVNLKSEFKNINMTFFTQFSNVWKDKLFGIFSGQLSMGGTTKNTNFNINGKIDNTFYMGVPLGTLKWKGNYTDKTLTFSEFTSDWSDNHISGSAILPIIYDLAVAEKTWHSDGELFVKTEGSFKSAVFLSTFLTETDSLVGDINIKLNIKGPTDNLIRDGEISIIDGSIYTVLMDEPINNIAASATLSDNIMNINSFSSTLYDSDLKKNIDNNINLSGKINFKRFFEPRYDLQISGENIFYRSLNEDVEGYGDLDLTLVGKDTLEIVGTIKAKNGAIYKEFTGDEAVASIEEKGRITTNYNVRFPIEDTFSIRNSQIDAKITGEIAMSRQFDSDWNYAGEIKFIEGNIYYYLGDVFEDLRGSMTLDGEGFNPFLELNASTQIGDAKIILGVYGPFDNPEWNFDSDKGYTESDILQLLTFNTRVAEEGITTEGLGTQAQTILGAYLERQLEKNFFKSTGLKSTGLIEDVEISGTSELINPGQGEEFSISAKVNKNFSLSYRRSFSLEAAYKNKVGVEYKLNPNFSVIGNVDETGQVHMKFRVRRVY